MQESGQPLPGLRGGQKEAGDRGDRQTEEGRDRKREWRE